MKHQCLFWKSVHMHLLLCSEQKFQTLETETFSYNQKYLVCGRIIKLFDFFRVNNFAVVCVWDLKCNWGITFLHLHFYSSPNWLCSWPDSYFRSPVGLNTWPTVSGDNCYFVSYFHKKTLFCLESVAVKDNEKPLPQWL